MKAGVKVVIATSCPITGVAKLRRLAVERRGWLCCDQCALVRNLLLAMNYQRILDLWGLSRYGIPQSKLGVHMPLPKDGIYTLPIAISEEYTVHESALVQHMPIFYTVPEEMADQGGWNVCLLMSQKFWIGEKSGRILRPLLYQQILLLSTSNSLKN